MTLKASTLTEAQLLATTSGFMGVQWATSAAGAKAAILGVPFDCGTHAFRIGSRQGPASIREQSRLVRAYESEVADYDVRAQLKLVDCGDVVLTPSRIQDAFARIEEASWRIVDAGTTPVGFGGDGSISVPLVRAAARKWPDLCVLHIDSHTDCHPINPDHPYDAASQCSRCGYCEQACPTYVVSGKESYSPRGRNQIVRMMMEGKFADPASAQDALDSCLLCGACVTAGASPRASPASSRVTGCRPPGGTRSTSSSIPWSTSATTKRVSSSARAAGPAPAWTTLPTTPRRSRRFARTTG